VRATKLLMTRRARSLFGLPSLGAAALALTLASLACTTPTLPLPPPTAPTVTTGTQPETARLISTQGAEPNALIIVINRNSALPKNKRVSGTLADENGSWDLEVPAKVGDFLDVSQETGTTRSAPVTVQVK
jgi:hypothetical protein